MRSRPRRIQRAPNWRSLVRLPARPGASYRWGGEIEAELQQQFVEAVLLTSILQKMLGMFVDHFLQLIRIGIPCSNIARIQFEQPAAQVRNDKPATLPDRRPDLLDSGPGSTGRAIA